MNSEACKSAALDVCTKKTAAYNPPKANTPERSFGSINDPTLQPVGLSADEIGKNLDARIDNQIQDALHERLDAERQACRLSLDEFLAGQG